jgi:hypothetical protein
MDAELYDHLTTTITNNSQLDAENEPDDEAEIIERETEPGSPISTDKPARQRAMSLGLPQEIDQVVHAIQSSPWAARFSSLVGSVKKQVSPP